MINEAIAAEPGAFPILVIEDHRDTAETLARLLELIGYHVQVAQDGHQAIELARRYRPHYVLLDLALPGLDGYRVASQLRQECAQPLVIIAITGYGKEDDRQRSRESGIDHHLLKPADFATLLSLLSSPQPSGAKPLFEPQAVKQQPYYA